MGQITGCTYTTKEMLLEIEVTSGRAILFDGPEDLLSVVSSNTGHRAVANSWLVTITCLDALGDHLGTTMVTCENDNVVRGHGRLLPKVLTAAID
jgi:hypothetical protein